MYSGYHFLQRSCYFSLCKQVVALDWSGVQGHSVLTVHITLWSLIANSSLQDPSLINSMVRFPIVRAVIPSPQASSGRLNYCSQ